MSETGRPGPRAPRSLSAEERQEYGLLILLERLESLVEDMDELGVSSRADAQARIDGLHAKLDQRA